MPRGPVGRTSLSGDIPVLLVAIAWGSSYLATKGIASQDTVIALLVLRFIVAVPLLALVVRVKLNNVTRGELHGGIVLGLIIAAVFLLETYGVVHTSATNAGLIISLTMVFTPLAEAALDRRRISSHILIAAIASVVGVGLLTESAGFSAPSFGDLLMLLAAVARTANVLLMHRMKSVHETDDSVLTFIQLGTAVLVFALISPFSGSSPWHVAMSFSWAQWADVIYLSIVCTLFALVTQLWAVRRTSPSRVSLLLGTEPLWAAVIGVAVGGDRFAVLGYVGGLLILVGTSWGRRTANRQAEADRSEVALELGAVGDGQGSDVRGASGLG